MEFKFSNLTKYNEGFTDIVLQPDGKILAAGGLSTQVHDSILFARYLSDGGIDSSFGINGLDIPRLPFGSLGGKIALQDNGKFISASNTYTNNGNEEHFLIQRFNNDGSADYSFGDSGYQVTEMGVDDAANGIIIQSDEKIVITGGAFSTETGPSKHEVALARYNSTVTKRQIIISKIKHYISTHNAVTLNKNISLYPNPVNNILTIKGLPAINNYQLIINNDRGSVVATRQVNNVASYQFNVQNLISGVYYVNVVTNNNIVTTLKFIKE